SFKLWTRAPRTRITLDPIASSTEADAMDKTLPRARRVVENPRVTVLAQVVGRQVHCEWTKLRLTPSLRGVCPHFVTRQSEQKHGTRPGRLTMIGLRPFREGDRQDSRSRRGNLARALAGRRVGLVRERFTVRTAHQRY